MESLMGLRLSQENFDDDMNEACWGKMLSLEPNSRPQTNKTTENEKNKQWDRMEHERTTKEETFSCRE